MTGLRVDKFKDMGPRARDDLWNPRAWRRISNMSTSQRTVLVQRHTEYDNACEVWRSFQNHQEPERMRMAADSSDQWFAADHSQFNVFYICKSGDARPCLIV